jgi:hypothetical protein
VGKPCSGCCVRQMGCEACQRCLPKYLCVDVTVVPGPYTDLSCCDIDDYGEGHFSFRLNNGCDLWRGSSTCPGVAGMGLAVALSADCSQTIVTSLFTDDTWTFEGMLPAGMKGIIENDAGDQFHWEISSASVVENPLAKDCDSPCTCLQCLPEKLCVLIHANATDTKPKLKLKVPTQWDCLTRSWVPLAALPDGVSVAITLLPASSGICGVKVDISANDGSYSGITNLGTGMHPRRFHGTPCLASDGTESVEGVPEVKPCPEDDPECPEPPVTQFISDIAISADLRNQFFFPVGSVSIKDQSCGDCNLPCEPNSCCPTIVIPHTLHATSSAPPGCENCPGGSTDWTLHYSDELDAWSASQQICDVEWSIRIWCVDLATGWKIARFCNGVKANADTGDEVSVRRCDPFHLKFLAVQFGAGEAVTGKPCECLDVDGNPHGLIMDVEVTA